MPLNVKSQPQNGSPGTAAVPTALTIAGSDCSGGAGIQADIKTFTALGVYGASVITALTAQNTRGVSAVQQVDPDFIASQFQAVTSDLRVGAIKTGMLGSVEAVRVVAQCIKSAVDKEPAADQRAKAGRIALIVDPVMIASSGARLLDAPALNVVKTDLLPLADLITPNLPEAAMLLGCDPAQSIQEMEHQVRALFDSGARAVLLKGGHAGAQGSSAQATDLFYDGHELIEYAMPWVDTTNTHGTGCTLSAAIAAFMARGMNLQEAIDGAKLFVWEALEQGRGQQIGQGRGPVNHLCRYNK